MGGYFPAAQIGENSQTDFLGNMAKVLAFKNAQQQSQLIGQQIQGAQLENQQRQLQLNQTQALNDAFKNAYSMDPTTGQPTFNEAGMYKSLADKGAGSLIPGLRESITKMNTAAADLQEKQTAVAAAHRDYLAEGLYAIHNTKDVSGHYDMSVVGGVLGHYAQVDPQGAANMQKQLLSLDPNGRDRMIDSLVQSSPKVQELANQAMTAQGALARGQAAQREADINQQKLGIEQQKLPGQIALTSAQTKEAGAKTIEAQANTQKTLAETQNLGGAPIFALDPKTNQRVMTTRTEAAQLGYTNPVNVKEGDIQNETNARAMINDVQLNKSRYQAAMDQMYREPMTDAQKTALVALTPEKLGLEIGHVFGMNIGMNLPDVIQKVSNASAFSVLSPTQKQAVLGYYSTLASVPAAQKALTNIGKANKEMMDLELRTIPTPIMDQGTVNAGLDRFQGNIDQTAAKTVRIPGMPETFQIRQQYERPSSAAPTIPKSISDLMNQFNLGRRR